MDRLTELYTTAQKFTTQSDFVVAKVYQEASLRSGPIEVGHGKYLAPLVRVAGQKGFPLFWRPKAALNAKFDADALTIYADPNVHTSYHRDTAEKNMNHIILGKGFSTVMTLRLLAHELAHVCTVDGPPPMLWIAEGARVAVVKSEVVAESAAMLVMSQIGHDVLEASAAYIVACNGTVFMPGLRPMIDRVTEEIIELGELHHGV